jgi:hypothetical protein
MKRFFVKRELCAGGFSSLLLVLGLLTAVGDVARAQTRVVWPFDMASDGPPAIWTAPSAIDPNVATVTIAYEINKMYSDAEAAGFTFSDMDVTGELDPALRYWIATFTGPGPHYVLDDTVVHPAPPADPGLQAHFLVGVQADGYGTVQVRDILLGTFISDLLGFPIPVTLLRVRLVGELTVYPGGLAVLVDYELVDVLEDETVQFAVRLSAEPPRDVTVSIVGDAPLMRVGDGALTFTPEDWDTPQVVTWGIDAAADGAYVEAAWGATAPGLLPAEAVVRWWRECDGNGVADAGEIASDAGLDCDGNGLLDRCQDDRDQDGVIDACDGCPDDPAKTTPGMCGCGAVDTADCSPAPPVDGTSPAGADDGVAPGAATQDAPAPDVPASDTEEHDKTPTEEWLLVPACGVGWLLWGALGVVGLVGLKVQRVWQL